MVQWINQIRKILEPTAFGVCSHIGKKMGIASKHIKLFFIYTTFIANWSPIIIYLILAFWLNMKRYIVERKNKLWEL